MNEQINIEPTKTSEEQPKEEVNTKIEQTPEDKEESIKQIKREEQRARLFAEKARKDRELQIFQKENNELKNKLTSYEKEKELLKSNPVDFIRNTTGMDYEDLTKLYLKQLEGEENKPDSPQKDSRVERLEEKLAELEKAKQAELQAKEQYMINSTINNHLNMVYNYCQKNSEEYEAILSHPDRAQNIYIDIYRQAYQLGGRDLDEQEIIAALKRTEDLLTSDLEAQADKLLKIKKLSSKFMTKEPEKKIEEPKPSTPRPFTSKVKTISNDMITGATDNKPSKKTMSAEELHKKKLAEIAAKFDK
jgi:hypothetical protein